ncbi:Aste57867_23215 [Aphanomyces stellatus]|uniref:Aste57867_23215 protein n=1 Tax=Aphanomyces stellatus TaxID=120398 RepID=A0A485LN75_9STRA|nr:hypothetical protein As57867_023144 [Aphanomyces stellatus]VFT99862.1 Aste57867_23215 [Aphanomyces stellatus]
MHREDLWPTLHVRQLRDPATADAIRAVVDLFPLVHIHKMTDLALVRRCTGVVSIAWHGDYYYPSGTISNHRWIADFASLPIVELDQRSEDHHEMNHFVRALPRLPPCLRTLRISESLVEDPDDLFEACLGESHLTSFCLDRVHVFDFDIDEGIRWSGLEAYSSVSIDEYNVEYLVTWLTTTPVERVEFNQVAVLNTLQDGTQAFYRALFYCPTLQHLAYTYSQLDGLASVDFASPLPMATLDLSGNGLNSTSIKGLCCGLRSSNVVSLDLSHNILDYESVQALVECLPFTRIRELKLNHTNIGDEGCKQLANVVPHVASLQHIEVSHCGITDTGADGLATMLRATPKLQVLDLDGNGGVGVGGIE